MSDPGPRQTSAASLPNFEKMPLAIVQGTPLTEFPRDLYIPPEALTVFLEAFEGPLDLLLYLIKRHNLNILDIPIAEVTRQYMAYVDLVTTTYSVLENGQGACPPTTMVKEPVSDNRFELVAEYLVMAAILADIKSRMLLPRREEQHEEEDPRAELVRRLQEYERFKRAAEELDNLPRVGREVLVGQVEPPEQRTPKEPPQVELKELLAALEGVLERAQRFAHLQVTKEPLSVRERMSRILSLVRGDRFTDFTSLFDLEEGRQGVVVTLLAVLELIKESLIELIQTEPLAPIYVKTIS